MGTRLAVAAAIAVALAGLGAAGSADASTGLRPAACRTSLDARGAHCWTLSVPIDRSGGVPGSIDLFVERVPAIGKSQGAAAIFPGGPGLATSLLGRDIGPEFLPLVAHRDLILFDQRGTGRSDWLDCDAALDPSYFVPAGLEGLQEAKTVQRCANRLGAKRSFFTTAESVADFDAVRNALGLDRVTLIGISYGTREAMEYARAFPQHVDRLVLDSVVADPGPQPEGLASLRAFGRVLQQVCAGNACARFTSDPVADLKTLVARLEKGPLLEPRPIGIRGCRTTIRITRSALWDVISGSDFDPHLLSELPVAISQAAHGNAYQLAELVAEDLSDRLYYCIPTPDSGGPEKIPADQRKYDRYIFSSGEQIARLCEDTPMPWSASTPVTERRRLFEDSFTQLSDADFRPFDRATAMIDVLPPLCKFWPQGHPTAPIAGGPLPSVPTLILSGLDDLRTPLEDAEALAQANPAARLVQVPNWGHAASGSRCGRVAITAFLSDQPVRDCTPTAKHDPAPVMRVRPYWG